MEHSHGVNYARKSTSCHFLSNLRNYRRQRESRNPVQIVVKKRTNCRRVGKTRDRLLRSVRVNSPQRWLDIGCIQQMHFNSPLMGGYAQADKTSTLSIQNNLAPLRFTNIAVQRVRTSYEFYLNDSAGFSVCIGSGFDNLFKKQVNSLHSRWDSDVPRSRISNVKPWTRNIPRHLIIITRSMFVIPKGDTLYMNFSP